MGVSYFADILLRYLQQVRADVEAFLEAGEFVERCFDGLGWKRAVGLPFDQSAGGGVPELDEARLEGRGRDSISRCAAGSCCESVM